MFANIHTKVRVDGLLREQIFHKLALVGIIPYQILFSFSSDKGRRTDSRISRKKKKFRLIRLSVLLWFVVRQKASSEWE